LYFQLPHLPEETCFLQAVSSAVEGTSQAVLGSSDQQKVLASLSPLLKSEKIPALLYLIMHGWMDGWMDMSTNHVEKDFNHPSSQ
jgi:hypothetical protein